MMATAVFKAMLKERRRRPEMTIELEDGPGLTQEYDGETGEHYPSWCPELPLTLRPVVRVTDAEGLDTGEESGSLDKGSEAWTLTVNGVMRSLPAGVVTDDSAADCPAGRLKVQGNFLKPGETAVLTYTGIWTDSVTGRKWRGLKASVVLECMSVTSPGPRMECDHPGGIVYNPLRDGDEIPVEMRVYRGGILLDAGEAGVTYGFKWYVSAPGSEEWEEYTAEDADPLHCDMEVEEDTRTAVVRGDRMPSGSRIRVTGWVLVGGEARAIREEKVLDFTRKTGRIGVEVTGASGNYARGQRRLELRALVKQRGREIPNAGKKLRITWHAGAATAGLSGKGKLLGTGERMSVPTEGFSDVYGGVVTVEAADWGPRRLVTDGEKALTAGGKVLIV